MREKLRGAARFDLARFSSALVFDCWGGPRTRMDRQGGGGGGEGEERGRGRVPRRGRKKNRSGGRSCDPCLADPWGQGVAWPA